MPLHERSARIGAFDRASADFCSGSRPSALSQAASATMPEFRNFRRGEDSPENISIPRVYRDIGMAGDGSHFCSDRGARRDRYRVYLSDEPRRAGEKWPRPFGLREKSGHTSLSALKVGPPHPAASASSGRIFPRNASHPYMSIHPGSPTANLRRGVARLLVARPRQIEPQCLHEQHPRRSKMRDRVCFSVYS